AAQLYETATILCVGLGENVDEALMSSIASSPQSYIHVQTAHHLEPLFELLAAVVSGKTASSVLLKEKMNAPHPFTLSKTGDLYPVNIQETATTDVSWFVSLLQEQAAKPVLKYQLQPKCLGWHSVAPEHAEAQWTMPEGQQHTTECGAGPKILVLPTGFAWTGWWLLNPLFWLIFGRFFKCPLSILAHKQKEWDTLPQPDMPKPLLVPDTSFYTPSIKPALVIGLGALGEWSLNRLKWHLQDRQIDEQQVDFLVIQDGSVHNRPAVSIHGCTLSDKERIILQPDLRPYLETLRQDGKAPDARAWIPWRQWLRESRPLTRYTDDRRKARLALLLQPDAVEQRIKENVTRMMQNKGIVLIVINAADAEGTGMLAEVAHMCASYGAGVTAILVPERISSPETTGLLRELERMLTMRGENILSDRGNTPHSTNKLFDRVIVANQMQANTQNTSEALGHLLWDILAYPEFLAQMPSDRHERCYQIEIQGQTLPQDSLWRWVRDKALSDLINQHWLQTNITANQVELLATNNETVQGYINTFWHYETVLYDRTPSKLLKKSALVIRQGNPLLILKDAIDIPLDQPYHEQKVFCDIERVAFSVYLEAWCYYMLENEGKNNHWGLPTLLEAVTQIQQNFEKLTDTVLRLSGNTALVKQLSFIASIYTDYHVILGGLRSSLERWIAVFVGWQPGMSV
ncbi:MAG: hypothetical protein KAH77_02810, partial [Thiomargarita sp.]|nr:hypothetical protein [Thiomargarita sp.]